MPFCLLSRKDKELKHCETIFSLETEIKHTICVFYYILSDKMLLAWLEQNKTASFKEDKWEYFRKRVFFSCA